MQYLVDGHNLIPKIPGMSLQALDDEIQLIERLQDFCRIKRSSVEVFFDNAPPGMAGTRSFGPVKAHFVRQGMTADQAIRNRLAQLGKSAAQVTVVSSDRAVAAAARHARARTSKSETFARQLREVRMEGKRSEEPGSDPVLSDEELDQWLDLFGQKGPD